MILILSARKLKILEEQKFFRMEEHMTEAELATMWKQEIEKSLAELSELREKLQPVDFSSDLWTIFRGAYGDIREDVAFLFCPKELLPEMVKIRRLDTEEKENEQILFDNLCENLTHQLSFYDATYLAIPYLVLLLEKKRKEQDFKWQMQVISEAGVILSTNIPYNEYDRTPTISEDILESYDLSIEYLKEMTKEFLQQNLERLKEEDPFDLQYFCTSILSILGDPEMAFYLLFGSWDQCYITCPNCNYYNENIQIDDFHNTEQILEEIEPAESVIGKWDQKSYEDTYLWFSNLLHILGIEEEWKIPYYYGTYTCPECGSKGILIDWMKQCEM